MSKLGTYKNPGKFKDEDKWLKFFTKQQLIVTLIAGVCSYEIIRIFDKIGLLLVGMILAVTIMALTFLLAFAKLPDDWYLYGGGMPAWKIAVRLIKKQSKKNRVIYLRNFIRRN